jgi:membrane protein implicated in regulation of membrane protease activity
VPKQPLSSEPTTRELAAQVAVQGAGLLGKGRQAGAGAVLLSAAAMLAGSAWLLLLAAAIAGIAVALPVWAAALLIAAALGAAGGLLALIATRRLRRARPGLPLTAESLRQDLAEIRERTSR